MQLTGENKGFTDGNAVFLFTIAIPAIIWFFGIKAKKGELKNRMTFKQGFIEGWKITLIFALVSPFIFLVYYTLVNPQIVNWVRHGSTDPTAIVIARDMLLQFVISIIIGVLTSLPIALLLKSRHNKK